jgi:hypothetical protein
LSLPRRGTLGIEENAISASVAGLLKPHRSDGTEPLDRRTKKQAHALALAVRRERKYASCLRFGLDERSAEFLGPGADHAVQTHTSCTVSLIQALFVRIASRAIGQSRSMIALAMSHRSVAMESGT